MDKLKKIFPGAWYTNKKKKKSFWGLKVSLALSSLNTTWTTLYYTHNLEYRPQKETAWILKFLAKSDRY